MSSMFELNFENEKKNIPSRTENQKDDRFWRPDVKKTPDGRYMAQIRILPQGIEGIREKKPVFVEQHTHMYRDEAHKVSLFAKCRKTLGRNEHCPICEASWAMYNTKQPAMQEKARHIRASITYIANVLIVDDDVHPENNGKVMLWRMTQKNYETLIAPLNEDTKAENRFKKTQRFVPWSPINGCNFNVIVTIGKNGFPDYSESCWDSNGLTNLADDDAGIEAILANCYQLDEFLGDIPSEEELARRYQEFCDTVSSREQSAILGASVNGNVNMENVHMAGDPVGQRNEAPAAPAAPEPAANKFDMSDGASVAAFMQSQTKTVSPAPKQAPAAAPQVQGTDEDDDLPF